MKRIALTLVVLLSCLVVQAEQNYTLSNPLNGEQNYHYTANNSITLEKGFLAAPQNGHEVVLDIDAYGVFPPSYNTAGGTSANNTHGVVGSLGGTVDVSLLGGAVYSIPIEVPQGLGGVQPQLSIVYNSQERNGLLGWGWNLGGLSSISRTNSTPYHDGHIRIGDRFCLDGKRLLKIGTGLYGAHGVSYRTEQDLMSKIVSYQETGIDGPSYFKVWTADGKVLHYGHSADSKAFLNASNQVNLWLLNHVEDRDGNTMEFHYATEADSYRLLEIVYSGNANDNITPALRVVFDYRVRDDLDITYVGDCLYRKRYLLDKITVFNENNEMYSYTITYQAPNPQNGYYYTLLKEIRLDAGDEHLNPTKIQWSNNNYANVSGSQLKYHITTHGVANAFENAVKFSGDFNGDGFDDILSVRPNNNGDYSQAQVFVNKGIAGDLVFDYLRSFNLSPNVSWIQVADLNGDGYDDIVISNRTRGILIFPDHVETEIYLSRRTTSGGFEFVRKYTPICSVPQNMVEAHLIGDFFGEGKKSILVQSVSDDKYGPESSLLYHYNETSEEFEVQQIPEHLYASRFFPADYDGDGITEILYKKENGATALVKLTQNGNDCHYEEVYSGNLTNWDDCFPGDYNGDGFVDVLFYTADAPRKWNIRLSKSHGFGEGIPLPQTFPYSAPGDYLFSLDRPHRTYHYIKVGDFDGNGCSDLALYYNDRFYAFYGPVRPDNPNNPFANIQQINTQAFNQYDNMEICLGNFIGQERLSFLGTSHLSRLPSAPQRLEVKKIIDGLGRPTEFAYDYLMPNPNGPSDNDFYQVSTHNSNHSHHVHCSPIPLRALKKLTTYNVSNKPVSTYCFYEGGLIHNQGKGFLGFSKTRQDDYCDGQLQKKAIRQYDVDYGYSIIHLCLTEEDVYDHNGTLMARSSYSNDLYTHVRNDKVYIPISDKSIEEYDVNHPNRLLKKEIYETEITTHCQQPGSYDEVISITRQTKGTTTHQNYTMAGICEFQESHYTTYLNNNYNTWLINRPSSTTTVSHREGNYADICHQKQFTYDSQKPHQVVRILDLPNDGSHPDDPMVTRTDYQYDRTGHVVSQTVSTPNDRQTPRHESFEYNKAYGRRLLTKHTDALNQETVYTYHPVYNYCTSVTDCNGLTTTYEQDPLGTTSQVHHPDGTLTYKVLFWDNSDVYLQWEKQTGHETKYHFFAPTGDLLKSYSYDIHGDLLMSEMRYDNLGRVVKKGTPHKVGEPNICIQYEYNDHNQVSCIQHPDGSHEDIEHDGNESRTTFFALDGSSQGQSKTVNAMGWVIRSTDAENNSILYDYRADGKPICSQIEGYNETRIEMEYDALGNRIRLTDPNYGTVTSEYNAFNEAIRQVTPKLDETVFHYDVLGRMVSRIETDHRNNQQKVTEWTYGTEQGQRGLLTRISTPNQSIQYNYDKVLRLSEVTECISGTAYRTCYTYDQASRVDGITYPSDYHVNYDYTSEGFLKNITDSNDHILWKTTDANTLSQPTSVVFGNGVVSEYGYDKSTHRLVSIQTRNGSHILQDLSYQYDNYSNLTERSDLKIQNTERFGYDALNRLTSVDDAKGHSTFLYDPLGRMTEKSDAYGTVFCNADYSGPKPHALKSVQAPHGTFPQERMDLVFNMFDKVERITEGTNTVSFEYGYDRQRIGMNESIDGTSRSKTYVNGCEYITNANGNTVVNTFIAGPSGVFAVAQTINGATTLHYIQKDHLGSWCVITNELGEIEQEVHFDAWGNGDNADHLMFDRGFTGHEHIKGMGLINMNGRLYDPVTSSMLSPDNNIQMPDLTQNYNRYAYCLNNPLTYTDPDGNTFLETALIFYLVYCTDLGYEFQKYTQAAALHIDLHLSSQQIGIGADFSFGIPKKYGISYRANIGFTYYWRFYDNSYSGFEFRLGGEWCAISCIGYSGTTFYHGKDQQTTNSIIIGTYWCNLAYENDYMFHLGEYIPMVPAADNGDRYRSAAARFRLAVISVGVNLYTGDPGVDHDDRRIFNDPDANGRETYTISANGDNPDEYRAGVFYVGVGPFKMGANSEQIRNLFQNRFAHDFLCKKDSPYFKVLDRPGQAYFYFGTETGSTLW